MLRSSVNKARQQGILPFTSLSEPEGNGDVLSAETPKALMGQPKQPTPENPFPWSTPIHNPAQSGLDQLAQVGQVADLDDNILWLNDFTFASWFPVASASGYIQRLLP